MPNRNASASANGWLFQVSAGVYLFLNDIKNNIKLKIEGEKEDIEIITCNGKKYIQVKCLDNVNSRTSVYSHYVKALQSLKDADDKKAQLVYFSNITDPFNTNEASYYDYSTSFSFNDLTKAAQNKIKEKLGDEFSYENLSIEIAHFYGTDESKKRFVLEKIRNFLTNIGESDAKANQIYDQLIIKCFLNATDRKKSISKETFVLHIVLPFLNQNISSEEFERIMDVDYYDTCAELYEKYLFSNEFNYELFIKISSQYRNYKTQTGKNMYDFINDKYTDFIPIVPDSVNEMERIGVVKIMLYRIISKHNLLEKIKKEAGI